ncbi:WecB/TagA/CpsF family glycosyltransferase [Paludibacterium yongneupense]|uniref:WecB/TagA/CpsF family glycosyltransferase n=1 Tax=Paludibacterium yongneupense TaxID=400061 RepID=UPI00040A9F25|nr:WecB/TagA/CpsF family glycosyltransferase [Paludibacterium yongneupense]
MLSTIMPLPARRRGRVIGASIDALDWDEALTKLLHWGAQHESRSVFICNAHSVVTARRDPAFSAALARADMATPDGMPVAWMLRWQGFSAQQRINGPDLMWRYCQRAEAEGHSLYLYGASGDTLQALVAVLRRHFPRLAIAGWYSPPFRPLSPVEDQEVIERINASGANALFVGLGCPKQELWMDEHRGRINAVMIGVGAAFDYHAGSVRRAPLWMQRHGLEWLHRLCSEPRRLWRRYLVTNTLFLFHALRQLLGRKD